jgi:hypothetical protein
MTDNKETKDVFIQVRYEPTKKAQVISDAQRLGYRYTGDMVRDAIRYFIEQADRSR